MAGLVNDVGPISFESVSAVTATPTVRVGTRLSRGDEDYIYVYNDGGEDIHVGNGCVISGNTGYSVTVSSTTAADFLVGVVKHATLTTATYGWVVTRGFTSIEMGGTSGTVAKGGLVELGDDGEFYPHSNTTANGEGVVGKALEAIVSSASGQAFIKCF